jgi:glycosyltransferase involved in cell wall biosynthesis
VRWQIITGEYPPQIGGISDYTRQAALGLVAAGDSVEIWTGPLPHDDGGTLAAEPADAGIRVHRLPDHFGPRALRMLDAAFGKGGGQGVDQMRALVQYEPWSFGWRGMNLPFCLWLWMRSGRLDIRVMFHEVCTDWGWKLRFKQNVLGAVTRVMAGLAVRAARRAFVTIPTWETLLRPMAGKEKSIGWLPVPSNMPRHADPERVRDLRRRLLARAGVGEDGRLVGHFGTFRGEVARMLGELLPTVLRGERTHGTPRVGAVLVGRGSEEFAARAESSTAEAAMAGRVIGAGSLPPGDVVEHLAACDVLVQPYPDGISARRTSSISGLGLGLATVTNAGELTEPFWQTSGAVRLTPSPSPAAMAEAVLKLLGDAPELERLRRAATACYEERFDAARLTATLREAD